MVKKNIKKNKDNNPWFNGIYDDVNFKKEIAKIGKPDKMQVGKENVSW